MSLERERMVLLRRFASEEGRLTVDLLYIGRVDRKSLSRRSRHSIIPCSVFGHYGK